MNMYASQFIVKKIVIIITVLFAINCVDAYRMSTNSLAKHSPTFRTSLVTRRYLRPSAEDDENIFDDDFEEDFDGKFGGSGPKRSRKKKTNKMLRPVLFNGTGTWKVLNRALFAGIFVAGIGTGITIDSAINTNPKDLASRDAIDKNAPNPKICAAYGSSAMVLDQRVFVTFNPFNVYVTQGMSTDMIIL